MKIPFGTRVRVKASIIRMHYPGNIRKWEKYDDVNYEAIFLGYRTLSDGKFGYNYYSILDEGSDFYWEIEKTHKGALICQKGKSPIKVFLEHIEVIDGI